MEAAAWTGLGAIAVALLGLIGQIINARNGKQQRRDELDAAERANRPEKAWARIEASADRAEKDAQKYLERAERAEIERDHAENALDELRATYRTAIEQCDDHVRKNRELSRLLEEERIANEALKRGKKHDKPR